MNKKQPSSGPQLTGKQIRHLRGLGHHLSSTVTIGKEGITVNLIKATEQLLVARELIKAKILETCPDDRRLTAADLADRTGSFLIQVLGRTFLLYRGNPDRKADERIALPK